MKAQISKIFGRIFTANTFLWLVYVLLLSSLVPHTAWAFDMWEAADAWRFELLGVNATPTAWAFAIVFDGAIAGLTHVLKKHIEEMPRIIHTRKAQMPKSLGVGKLQIPINLQWWPVFSYRYLNAYMLGLVAAWLLSTLGNLAHAVQFGREMTIFSTWGIPSALYALAFGAVLPTISLVFARVLSSVRESEQEEDPAFVKAKGELKEANSTIRSLEQKVKATEQQANTDKRLLEQQLSESEQRYRAVGDVVRYLFGTDLPLRERVRGIRTTFPVLSQNGIAQLVGCSVSTVNDALQGYVVEMPVMDNAQ